MNGAVSRRIRRASYICKRRTKDLKREYREKPYHQRGGELPKGVLNRSHSESDKFWHLWRENDLRLVNNHRRAP